MASVRKATDDDANDISNLFLECFSVKLSPFAQATMNTAFVAVVDSAVVGAIFADERSVNFICVSERFRRRGIGQLLLKRAIEEAKLKTNKLILSVRVDNDSAIALYEKCGFEFLEPSAEPDLLRMKEMVLRWKD